MKASKLGRAMLGATSTTEDPADFFSFRPKHETMTGDQPSTFRIAAPASDDNGSTEQCYHIIAGYAPATAHTNAGECEEYYDVVRDSCCLIRDPDPDLGTVGKISTITNAHGSLIRSRRMNVSDRRLIW